MGPLAEKGKWSHKSHCIYCMYLWDDFPSKVLLEAVNNYII